MKIYFNHTSLHALQNKNLLLKKFKTILDSGKFFNGHENQQLKENLQSYFKTDHVTLCASGHDALLLALNALKITEKDEVIFPVNAYPTAFAIALSKAKLVPVDVDENGQIDPQEIQKKITPRTKVIIIVHLYGLVGQLEEVIKLAKKHHITLIEDCAQAYGTLYKKKFVGTYGDIGCFSFYPTKNLGTLGDGGAISTNNKKYHDYFSQAVSYGEAKQYASDFVSGHSRIPELQAGALNIYFQDFSKEEQKKQTLANYYCQHFKDLAPHVKCFYSNKNSHPIHHLFVIKAKKRDTLRQFLNNRNIPTLIHYPTPIHLVKAFKYLRYKKGDFPAAEKLSTEIISIPFHPLMKLNQASYIIKTIKDFYYA